MKKNIPAIPVIAMLFSATVAHSQIERVGIGTLKSESLLGIHTQKSIYKNHPGSSILTICISFPEHFFGIKPIMHNLFWTK